MARSKVVVALLLTVSLGSVVRADVKTEERTLVQFEGMLGRMMRMFGGKAAKDGIVESVSLQGNRMARMGGESGEIVDLAEEKVYQLDLKKKTYRALTFEQLRQQYEATMKKVEQQTQQMKEAQEPAATEQSPQQQMEMDFTVSETGQHRTISGYDCREVVSTVTIRQKDKTLEQAGGMVITTTMWMAPKVPALAEIAAFEAQYAQKLMGPQAMVRAQEMMTAIAMYPGLKDAMSRAAEEAAKLDGSPLLTVAKVESVTGTEQAAEQERARKESEDEESAPTNVGGLGGLLGKKLTKKKAEEPKPQGASNRTTVMTTTTEYLKISDAVAPGDLAIPAGFRERGQAQ